MKGNYFHINLHSDKNFTFFISKKKGIYNNTYFHYVGSQTICAKLSGKLIHFDWTAKI